MCIIGRQHQLTCRSQPMHRHGPGPSALLLAFSAPVQMALDQNPAALLSIQYGVIDLGLALMSRNILPGMTMNKDRIQR